MQNRILLVDDEVGILLAFKKLIETLDTSVDTAQTIEEAEALLKQRRYQAVIVDLRLTGILGQEGLEVIRYVKENNLDASIILITGYGNPGVMSEAYRLGADFYFEKPVRAEALKEALRSLRILS